MTTLIKLVLAALILNAAARAGMAAFNHYQFVDAAREAMVFAPNASDAQLVQTVARIASEYDVPVTAEDLNLRHQGQDIIVEFSYDRDIALVPGVYTKRWTFSPVLTVRSLRLIPTPRP